MSVTASNVGRLAIGIQCRFGSLPPVPAARSALGRLECPIPSHAPGLVAFTLVTDVGYTSNALQFLFSAPVVLTEVEPFAAASDGGAEVALSGSGFVEGPYLGCLFGSGSNLVSTRAHYVEATQVKCRTPAVSWEMPRESEVRVTNNGVHHSNPVTFLFYKRPFVSWLEPPFGQAAGGERAVIVHGRDFSDEHNGLLCFAGEASANKVSFVGTR